MGRMFDVDDFLDQCVEARAQVEPRRAIKEVLARALAAPGEVAGALAPTEGGLTLLHRTDELTVLHVVWAPKMRLYPHDHRMWAAIGIYTGQEDNEFFRRQEHTLAESGGKRLETGDIVLLGDDTIHAVTNPRAGLTGAIHIYGGDFVDQPRSQWDRETLEEQPYDMARVTAEFERAEQAFLASQD